MFNAIRSKSEPLRRTGLPESFLDELIALALFIFCMAVFLPVGYLYDAREAIASFWEELKRCRQ
jgi:hypothetical protein